MDERTLIREWFRLADQDIAYAKHGLTLHPLPLEAICFHCQQAAEKYLKGYLVSVGVTEPPKTHDLLSLCELCSEYDGAFEDIRKPCSRLSNYGVQPRYPDEIYIDEEIMRRALLFADEIKAFAPLAQLRQKIEE